MNGSYCVPTNFSLTFFGGPCRQFDYDCWVGTIVLKYQQFKVESMSTRHLMSGFHVGNWIGYGLDYDFCEPDAISWSHSCKAGGVRLVAVVGHLRSVDLGPRWSCLMWGFDPYRSPVPKLCYLIKNPTDYLIHTNLKIQQIGLKKTFTILKNYKY